MTQDSNLPFADLPLEADEMQEYLRRDIGRRRSELILLSRLGRAYLVAPWLVEKLLPTVFRLAPYTEEAIACCREQRDGSLDCTLCESSIVPVKGIPFRLNLRSEAGSITSATLLGVGCDLRQRSPDEKTLSDAEARDVCDGINADAASKRLVVRAIVEALSRELGRSSRVAAALSEQNVELVRAGDEIAFAPREELWAREGSSFKWVQRVSGWYFAKSRVQTVRFAGDDDGATNFVFYYDPDEPLNSEDPTMNVNPEVIYSAIGGG